MSFFKNFDNLLYDFTVASDKKEVIEIVQDLTTSVSTYIDPVEMQSLATNYTVIGDETPEMVAYKLYGDTLLHWTIFYINAISDLYSQWPLSQMDLKKYCTEVYGIDINAVKHYEKLPERIVMDLDFITEKYGAEFAVPVTNYEYEIERNEMKRFIRVIAPEHVGNFAALFMRELGK